MEMIRAGMKFKKYLLLLNLKIVKNLITAQIDFLFNYICFILFNSNEEHNVKKLTRKIIVLE